MHTRSFAAAFGAALTVIPLLANPLPAAELSPAAEQIKKDIYYLAGDECQGRGVETKGILKAGEYIADTFKKAGLKPAGKDGTYFQPFTISGAAQLGEPNKLTLVGRNKQKKGEIEFKYGSDFTVCSLAANGKLQATDVAFAGYGITAKDLKYDDYAGADVKGKFVVLLRRTPRADDKKRPFDPSPQSQYAALATKVQNAVAHEAAGVLFVNDTGYAKDGDPLMDFRYAGGQPSGIPVLHIKRAVAEKLLADTKTTLPEIEKAIDEKLKPQTIDLPDWAVATEVTVDRVKFPVRNIVAVSEGTGPLADETVVIGAHYDHLGMGEGGSLGGPGAKGKVHYGADDNGSGTTGLLELARRFGARTGRVGRRVVFVAFSGEERGLFGSIHYCKEPPFPLEKTVFMLNMDMIGRVVKVEDDAVLAKAASVVGTAAALLPGAVVPRDRVVVYGTGTAPGLDALVTRVNETLGFKIIRVPGGSGPSDHDSFYRKHVPVLFFFTGTHRDYHRPTDTPDKINLEGLNKIVDMVDACATYFASSPEKPKYQTTAGGWSDPTEDRPRASRPPAPKLGIMPGNYEAKEGGVLVEDLSPDGAAEKAGVKPQDVIISIAGKPVKNIETYMSVMASQKPGVEIEVIVLRKDQKVPIKVKPQ
ncbi:M28 family peptidase [Fimbriiglobus ruber]|uniref:Aminopeptidase n=1 Tax=Fimbriiglobus ruber TaxID=1908690 RepID=A0A225E9R8_9BACT|nr:M28 family peptidase [Fimbriiglobus ruber]OWK45167.1 Aminopeptidase [Fimbriiglobus ruber]